jgi:hypothetical protein
MLNNIRAAGPAAICLLTCVVGAKAGGQACGMQAQPSAPSAVIGDHSKLAGNSLMMKSFNFNHVGAGGSARMTACSLKQDCR